MPLDFWLWGHLKDKVYAEKPQTIDELKRLITEKIAEIPAEMIADACEAVNGRALRCLDAEGKQLTT